MRSVLVVVLGLAACYPPPVEQCDQFRNVLCARAEDCGGNSKEECMGTLEADFDCDDVYDVSDPKNLDLCIQDLVTIDCDDLGEEPPDLGAACDSVSFYYDE